LAMFQRVLVETIGGFRPDFQDNEEYDLVLRCTRACGAGQIRHIPRVLYHRHVDGSEDRRPSALENFESGKRAISDHLASLGITATVQRGRAMGYQVSYPNPMPHPRVTVLIATTANPAILKPCITSVLARTSYHNFDVLLLVNERNQGLTDRAALLNHFAQDARVRTVSCPDRPFNYSWVNNLGAKKASGEILCFLNDDTEVITGDWLEQLVARVSLPDVAAAGPMLYHQDETIQHAGVILGLGGIAGHACHQLPRGEPGYFGRACLEQDVSCVTAACMVIRSKIFRELGGFDETMPLAYNDVDLCIRVRQAGWRIIWTPAVELYHRQFASLGKHNSRRHSKQFASDVNLMRQRWGDLLTCDPFYNRNLSLDRQNRLAFPPRL